jgi:hypothetical protein
VVWYAQKMLRVTQTVYEGHCNYRCGCNDHRHLQSLSAHSLIIALTEPLKLPNCREQAITLRTLSMSEMAILQQLRSKMVAIHG